jgi:hypothetical protein
MIFVIENSFNKERMITAELTTVRVPQWNF